MSLGFAILVIGVYVLMQARKQALRGQYYSFLASACTLLLIEDTPETQFIHGNLNSEWRFLTNPERKQVVTMIVRHKNEIDGVVSDEIKDVLIDTWGQHVLIAGRKLSGKPEYVFISGGPDRVIETPDDIVFPGARIPKDLSQMLRYSKGELDTKTRSHR